MLQWNIIGRLPEVLGQEDLHRGGAVRFGDVPATLDTVDQWKVPPGGTVHLRILFLGRPPPLWHRAMLPGVPQGMVKLGFLSTYSLGQQVV